MRTCPKEEDTVQTCDGMNQKNMIFEKNDPKTSLKIRKITKKKGFEGF